MRKDIFPPAMRWILVVIFLLPMIPCLKGGETGRSVRRYLQLRDPVLRDELTDARSLIEYMKKGELNPNLLLIKKARKHGASWEELGTSQQEYTRMVARIDRLYEKEYRKCYKECNPKEPLPCFHGMAWKQGSLAYGTVPQACYFNGDPRNKPYKPKTFSKAEAENEKWSHY